MLLLLKFHYHNNLLPTVNSFVEIVQYLLSHPNAPGRYILSERFSQDAVENYFGKQRSKGGRNENPTAKQCLDNASSLRLQGSLAMDPVRGNCQRKRHLFQSQPQVDNTPLPKRKKNRLA